MTSCCRLSSRPRVTLKPRAQSHAQIHRDRFVCDMVCICFQKRARMGRIGSIPGAFYRSGSGSESANKPRSISSRASSMRVSIFGMGDGKNAAALHTPTPRRVESRDRFPSALLRQRGTHTAIRTKIPLKQFPPTCTAIPPHFRTCTIPHSGCLQPRTGNHILLERRESRCVKSCWTPSRM
jgi:hypothetical protein